MNLLRFVLMIILIVLIISSIACLCLACLEAITYDSQYDFQGALNFLNFFYQYGKVFGATIALLAIFIALLSVNKSSDQIKTSGLFPWCDRVLSHLVQHNINTNNSYMYSYFERLLFQIYNQLYDCGFQFKSTKKMCKFINKYFVKQIYNFEQYESTYITNGGLHDREDRIYSFDNMWQVLMILTEANLNSIDNTSKRQEIFNHCLEKFNSLTNITPSAIMFQRTLK